MPMQTLTITEKIAVQAIVDKFSAHQKQMQETQQVFQHVIQEIATSHPGFHLNTDTFQLEADAPATAAEPAATAEAAAE
jgi:hypothetical protein